MYKLIERLSPGYPSDVHAVVSEVIKGIIAIAAPSPGSGVSEGASHAPPSNLFARELARGDSLSQLTNYILTQYGTDPPIPEGMEGFDSESLPNHESSTSAVIHSIGIIIELVRQNNSDYFEPYLFHTLRNRLIQYQQQLHTYSNKEGRQLLEKAMQEMVDRMGVVHLGPLLDLMCGRLEDFQRYLVRPRSLTGTVSTTIGHIIPLTFERYRICELYAELLHASNMSILNRPSEFDHLYDNMGRLQGGLSSLEELAKVISTGNDTNRDADAMDDDDDPIEPPKELPVSTGRPMPSHDSDEDMMVEEPGSSDDEEMEEISMSPPPTNVPLPPESSSPVRTTVLTPPQLASPASGSPTHIAGQKRRSASSSESGSTHRMSKSSRQSSRKTLSSSTRISLPLGERLKKRFLELNVLSTLLDLFFEFPWNNFLHSVVYDIIHQILTGRDEHGHNRELIISLFRDARVMHRIIEGQKQNDIESGKPKGLRLGYMGHLTLISEDVITILDHSSPELRLIIKQFEPQPEWKEYVNGRYRETKSKDTSLLGGGKPALSLTRPGSAASWKVDEQDIGAASPSSSFPAGGGGLNAVGAAKEIASRVAESQKEFRKSAAERREVSTHFDPGAGDEGDTNSSSGQAGPSGSFKLPDDFGSSDDDDSDEDEQSGWLASSTFRPSAAAHDPENIVSQNRLPDAFSPRRRGMDRRPLSEGFDDVFDPSQRYGSGEDDHFEADDDEGFGPFSDSGATSDADPFTFSTSFSRELDDSTFDTFGDFGEFQTGSRGGGERRHSRGGSDLSDSSAFGGLGDSTGSNGFGEMGGTGSNEMMSSWDSWTMATAGGSFADEDVEVSNRERERQRREGGSGGPSK